MKTFAGKKKKKNINCYNKWTRQDSERGAKHFHKKIKNINVKESKRKNELKNHENSAIIRA